MSEETQERDFPIYDRDRRKWQDPEGILDYIGLKVGDIFIDMGCGTGFFTLPAARIVGPTGRVYGVDVDEEKLTILRERSDYEGLENIVLERGSAENTVFNNIFADFVFFGIVLHDFRDQTRVLKNAQKMLKPTGRLIDLDFKKDAEVGPPRKIKFNVEYAIEIIMMAGFKIIDTKIIEPYSYLIIAAT